VLTTDQKGALAEQAIAFEALTHGVGVSRPLGDERYDLIFDLRPRLLRIQSTKSCYLLPKDLRSCGRASNYDFRHPGTIR
jgi:hypothetical protein